ncbi:MAG: DUF3108 domain-containing protein [Bacteroidota bacterium]
MNSSKLSIRCTVLLLFFLCLTGYGWQGKDTLPKPQIPDTVKAKTDTTLLTIDTVKINSFDTLRTIANKAFTAGEYLKFDVKYGFVTAGDAAMRIIDTTIPNGRQCWRVNFSVDSKPFFNWIFKVVDRYCTFIDSKGLFPWRFEQHIREGTFSRDFTADFDQVKHMANTSEKNYRIPPYVHDIMSAFYFARTIDYSGFRPGQKIHLQNFFKDSTYELDVKYKGRQQVEVPAGKFNCIVIEPLAREGGLFKSDGQVYIWLTDDDRKMPVKVSSKIVIGSIDSELIEYRGLNGPLPAKVQED